MKERGVRSIVVIGIVVVIAAVGVGRYFILKVGGKPLIRSVSVSISPGSQLGDNGATLTYTVTVNNTGNVSDNYSLSVSDNSGWGPTVLPTSLTVPAGENRTATLSVTIPNPPMIWEDYIWVKAISNNNAAVFDNESCLAHEVHSHPASPVS